MEPFLSVNDVKESFKASSRQWDVIKIKKELRLYIGEFMEKFIGVDVIEVMIGRVWRSYIYTYIYVHHMYIKIEKPLLVNSQVNKGFTLGKGQAMFLDNSAITCNFIIHFNSFPHNNTLVLNPFPLSFLEKKKTLSFFGMYHYHIG